MWEANGLWLGIAVLCLMWFVAMGYAVSTLNGMRDTFLRRTNLWCDSKKRDAEVEFLTWEGRPYSVNRCSILGDRGVTCGQRCLEVVGQAA